MEFRRLGGSGLKVSEISYGNWLTHGSQIEAEQATKCVHAALDAGITTFDTADVYAGTKAETVLGEALKGQRRDGYELFTKVYWPTGPGKNDRGLSRKHILASCEASLKRLQTDHLDLYQAHRFDYETPLEETLRAFDDLVTQGKVHYIGVSEWDAKQIADAVRIGKELGLHPLVSNQPQYNILWRVIEAEVVPVCESNGISQIVWSPMAQGALSGKYLPGQPVPEGSRGATDDGQRFMKQFLADPVLTAVQNLKPLAAEAGLTMPQLAVAWTLANPNVASAIVGATKPEQVTDNVTAAGVTLEKDLLAKIDEVLSGLVVTDPKRTQSPNPRP